MANQNPKNTVFVLPYATPMVGPDGKLSPTWQKVFGQQIVPALQGLGGGATGGATGPAGPQGEKGDKGATGPQGPGGGSSTPTNVTVSGTFATNMPYFMSGGFAQHVTSVMADPFVDGITLSSGTGTLVHVANLANAVYTTPLALPGSDQDVLYVSQTGTLTTTVPSSAAGDVWEIAIARRLSSNSLVYSPQVPIKLA